MPLRVHWHRRFRIPSLLSVLLLRPLESTSTIRLRKEGHHPPSYRSLPFPLISVSGGFPLFHVPLYARSDKSEINSRWAL